MHTVTKLMQFLENTINILVFCNNKRKFILAKDI